MVHRKSEYRLNYKWLPSNVCREERLTSADYRIQRRRSDFSHHSWGWQLDRCDCEEDDECDRYLPLPPNRQKHNHLIEQWRKDEMIKCRLRGNELNNITPIDQTMISLPAPTAAQVQLTSAPIPSSPVHISDHRPNLTRGGGEKYDTYLPDTYEIPTRTNLNDHTEKNTGNFDQQFLTSQEAERRLNTGQYDRQNLDSQRSEDLAHLQKGPGRLTSILPSNDEFTLAGGIRRNLPIEPRRKKTDITPVEPSLRPVRWRSPSPIKKFSPKPRVTMPLTSKLRPPFHSYGWANVVDSVGKQETNNVCSQAPGVRSSASRAEIAREVPLRLSSSVGKDTNLTRSKSAVNLSTYPINHSSLWMTEYQSNYSKAMRG